MAVPYTFGSATTSIPLSQLDSNFATAITLGNTAVQLGNTITNLTGVTNLASPGALSLGTNGNTTAIYADTSQNVGIGTSSPQNLLNVVKNSAYASAASNAGVAIQSDSGATYTAGLHFGTDKSGVLSYIQSDSSASYSAVPLAINPLGGNVGIGTASPIDRLSVNGNIAFVNTQSYVYSNGGSGSNINSGFFLDGSGNTLRLYTNSAERARIDSSGNLLVGTTTAPSAGNIHTAVNGSSAQIQLERTNSSAGSGFVGADSNNAFNVYNGSVVQRFYVTQAGACFNTTGTYGTISDIKLKENIEPARGYLEDLCKVNIVKYSLKAAQSPKANMLGVIAQELEQIFPSMIEEAQDLEDEVGNPTGTTTKTVKYSIFVPMLIKALQEQQAIIQQLQADVAALKGSK